MNIPDLANLMWLNTLQIITAFQLPPALLGVTPSMTITTLVLREPELANYPWVLWAIEQALTHTLIEVG